MPHPLSWIEVDMSGVESNIKKFKALLPKTTQMMAVVKGEAYGHGMIPVARCAAGAGCDWLGVFHLGEGLKLREEGISLPILALGYVPLSDLQEAVSSDIRITLSSLETLDAASRAAQHVSRKAKIHLKLETGTNRLGLEGETLRRALDRIRGDDHLFLEGAHTHFANIEDTTEHDYAGLQLQRFKDALAILKESGFDVPLPHTACTAAAILFPQTYFEMVRVGIGMYGMWPSKETYLSALQAGKSVLALQPAMTWKTIVAQVKQVPMGVYIGYGCSYRTTRPTTLAILPVGYANGYDRLFSNRAHVLIRGVRAPVRGRVCMNLIMVDVTDIPGVALEDEVVLLGKQGAEQISAETMASWASTINYEIVTRIDPAAPRILKGNSP
jgi:alanine racemase